MTAHPSTATLLNTREGWCWKAGCTGRAIYPPDTATGIYTIQCDSYNAHHGTIRNLDRCHP